MAEAGSPTNKYYAKCGATMANVNTWICLDGGNMDAFDATTNAAASEVVASGLARAAATMTNETNTVSGDVAQAYKSFSAGAAANVNGALTISANVNGDSYGWHRWATMVSVASGDTVNETIKNRFMIGT